MEIIKEKRRSELACVDRVFNKSNDDRAYHWHENIEICYIRQGDFSFFADGEHIDADTGDIVVFGEYSVRPAFPGSDLRKISD